MATEAMFYDHVELHQQPYMTRQPYRHDPGEQKSTKRLLSDADPFAALLPSYEKAHVGRKCK